MKNPLRKPNGSERLAVSAAAVALIACRLLQELGFGIPTP